MRAYIAAKEPNTALNILEECDPALMEPRSMDQTHNVRLINLLSAFLYLFVKITMNHHLGN